MKRVAVVLFLAVPALAHKVPAGTDNPALQYLKDEKRPDLAEGVAKYCTKAGIPMEICVGRLGHDLRAAEAAMECAKRSSIPFDPMYAHQVGLSGSKSKEEDLIYHSNDILPSDPQDKKDFGEHHHEWSEGAKSDAGMEKGAEYVQKMKEVWEGYATKETKGLDADARASLAGEMAEKIAAKLPGLGSAEERAALKMEIAAHIEKKSSSEETVSGPPAAVIERAFEKGKERGEKYPESTRVVPDILVSKDPNKSVNTNLIQPTKVDVKPDPFKPSPSSPAPSTPASSCNPNIQSCAPDLKKSAIAQGGETPLENCQKVLYLEKTAIDLFSTYEQQSAPQESLRKRAEDALMNGICLTEWFGENFCQAFNNQKTQIQTQPDSGSVGGLPAPESLPPLVAGIDPLIASIEQPAPTTPSAAEAWLAEQCKDPLIPDAQKVALGCAGTVDPWCNDYRATEDEKRSLGCPGY